MLAVGNCCYVAICSAVQGALAPTGRRGAGHTVAAARLQLIITAARDVVFLPLCVCLSISLSTSYRRILTKFYGMVGYNPETNR